MKAEYNVLKILRSDLGYTQTVLANISGLSLRTIQRLEAGNKRPKGHTLIELAKVFRLSPDKLLSKYTCENQNPVADMDQVRFINLSVLSFLGLPFGNLLLPFILWRNQQSTDLVDELTRRIINFQVIFSSLLAFLLSVSPFISYLFFSNRPIILIVLFTAYALNVIVVSHTALKIQREDYGFLDLPIRVV